MIAGHLDDSRFWEVKEEKILFIHFPCQNFYTLQGFKPGNVTVTSGYQHPISSYLIHFHFGAKIPFEHFVSLSVDNYLAMDVACTLVCPRANQEVIITHSAGNETQKCEKCEGDCPKGGIIVSLLVSLWVICLKTPHIVYIHSIATLLGSPAHLHLIIQSCVSNSMHNSMQICSRSWVVVQTNVILPYKVAWVSQ